MNLTDVQSVDVGGLKELEISLSSRVQSLEEAKGKFAKITQFPSWFGAAKDAAAGSFANIDKSLIRDIVRVSAVHQAVSELAEDFAQLQTRVRDLETEAQAIGGQLDADGTVHVADDSNRRNPNMEQRIHVISEQAHMIMQDADRIDQKVGEVLRKALNGEIDINESLSEDLAVLAGRIQGEIGIPEPPSSEGGGPVSPERNTGWWNDLTDNQKKWVINEHPDWIGNRDGVSASARDQANRIMLPKEIANLETEVDRLQKKKDKGTYDREYYKTYSDLWYAQRRLEGAKATQRALEDNPGTKLILCEPQSGLRGRVAIATGDPDTADHIAVTTPGVNSSPEHSIGGLTREAVDLKTETQMILDRNGHENETVATIAWIGYEPPQAQIDVTHMDPRGDGFDNVGPGGIWDEPGGLADVASDEKAKIGAASLSRFYEGIHSAWHPGDSGVSTNPNITALGHSYGSLTTSLALQQTSPGLIDNAIFYGSPGIELNSVDKLPVAHGHAYAMQAPDDPIIKVPRYTGHFGEDPVKIPGMTRLSTVEGDTTVDEPPGKVIHHEGAHGHSDYPRKGGNNEQRMTGYNMSVVIAGMTGHDGRPDLTRQGE